MKKFLRNLSIEERKIYYNVIFYSIFHSISSLIIKILIEYYKIGFLSITAETGSIICMISMVKILLFIKRDKQSREKLLNTTNLKIVIGISFLYAFNFILMVLSIKYSKMSTFYIILRLSTFIKLFFLYMIYNEKIYSFQLISGGIVLLCISFINSLSLDSFTGLLFCLSFTVNYSFILIYSRNIDRTKSEIISFFQGLYLALIGGFLMIVSGDNLLNFTFRIWIYIIILSFLNYHVIYFESKTLILGIVNQMLPFKFLSIFFSFFCGFFIVKEKVSVLEVIFTIVIFITIGIYSSKFKEITSCNKNGSTIISSENK